MKILKTKRVKKPTKTKTIEWNFGEKHKAYIRRAKDSYLNIAEGAVRAGKTIDNVFAFAMELETTPDKIHLATGSTGANAKLNIGDANGFGLEYIFRGRSRWGRYKSYECLYIGTATGEKVVIFQGAGKANSYKRIQGNSYGMWIATELSLHHNESIKEGFDRTLMAQNRKIFWDLNPVSPKNFVYVDYIDKYTKQDEDGKREGGVNFENFTIYDNINLTEERKRQIESEYTPGTVWHKRNILGMRTAAEGLIYQDFANNPEKYEIESTSVPSLRQITVGVDFGGTGSKHSFVATGIDRDYENVYVLASERIETGISPYTLAKKYTGFIRKVEHLYGKVNYTYTDAAEQVLNIGFREQLVKEDLRRIVADAKKIRVNDRIRATQNIIDQERFYYTEHAYTVRDALSEALWEGKDSTEDKRLDNGTTDIDTLDAFEYSFERDIEILIHKGR